MRRISLIVLVSMSAVAATASGQSGDERLPLPNGWQPEGIASGPGQSLYVGSISTGAVLRLNARTGQTKTVVPAEAGASAIGVEADGKNIVVAGGETGEVNVYDRRTGKRTGGYANNDKDTFVNDIARIGGAYYATDSRQPVLYRLTRNGREAGEIKITGVPFEDDFNLNGIEAVGKFLVAVHSTRGELYRIDPKTGETLELDLGGAAVKNGDGLLAQGRKLYVVQNRDNQVAVVKLNRTLTAGSLNRGAGSPDFDVPTTIARKGGDFYAVNARFGTESPETAEYWVTRFKIS